MYCSTLVLGCHLDGVMDHLAAHCRLNDHISHFPGAEIARLELEGGVRVVLADLCVRDGVVDLDPAILSYAIVAVLPVIIPNDLQVGEDVLELGMLLVDPSLIFEVDLILGKSLFWHADCLSYVIALSFEFGDAVWLGLELGLPNFQVFRRLLEWYFATRSNPMEFQGVALLDKEVAAFNINGVDLDDLCLSEDSRCRH